MNNAGDGNKVVVVVGHRMIDVRIISAVASKRYCVVDAVLCRFPVMPPRIVPKRVASLGAQMTPRAPAYFRLAYAPVRPMWKVTWSASVNCGTAYLVAQVGVRRVKNLRWDHPRCCRSSLTAAAFKTNRRKRMETAMQPKHFQPGEGKSFKLGRMTMTFNHCRP